MTAEELLEEVAGRLWQVSTIRGATTSRLHEEVATISRWLEAELTKRRLGIGGAGRDGDQVSGRGETISKVARLIHQRSGHVDNHHGWGGCHEAAEEIVGMFPPDAQAARFELDGLEELIPLKIAEVVDAERKRCAGICVSMVVGGRAWTHDQEVAAKALLAAAEAIRNPVVKP